MNNYSLYEDGKNNTEYKYIRIFSFLTSFIISLRAYFEVSNSQLAYLWTLNISIIELFRNSR